MKDYSDAVNFRAAIIRKLAKARPDLCGGSGSGFWPVPVMGPVILAKCIFLLHFEWLHQIKRADYRVAEKLAEVRTRLTQIVAEGDLGEDHAGLYIKEHTAVKDIRMEALPFFKVCQTILKEEDPFILLGFIYNVETGSLEAIKALVETNMICNGHFAQLHLVEEIKHEKLANEIKTIILQSPYRERFIQGCDLHDRLYEEMVV